MTETEQTWRGTEIELEYIQSQFVHLHNIGDKNWTPEQKLEAYKLRRRCIELGEYRYYLLRNNNG